MAKHLPYNHGYGTFADMWAKRAARRDDIIRLGQCSIEFHNKKRFQVICPHSAEFRDRALVMGGVFRHRAGVWSFRAALMDVVIKMCKELYPGKVTVRPYGAKPYKPKEDDDGVSTQ